MKRDIIWIEKNIGEYSGNKDIIEYYWNIIGDRYQIKDNKVYLNRELYFKISGSPQGRKFLNRWFKREKRLCKLLPLYSPLGGIYGIWRNKELVYIGMTQRDFNSRWQEHLRYINREMERPSRMKLYGLLDQKDQIDFREILRFDQLKVEGELSRRDMEAIELGLISLYRPIGNIEGIDKEYRFSQNLQ